MKKLTAKIGEYQKDGQTKGRYANLGVMMNSNDGGEYLLLDPTVSIGGVLALQNALAISKGEQVRDRVMVGVWEEDNNQQGQQQYQQQAPQQNYQQAPQQQQQQYQQPQSNQYQNGQGYQGN